MKTTDVVASGEVAISEPQCEVDHKRWLEEIDAWKRDHERALEALAETAEFIRRHDAELDDHLREIETHREHHRAGSEPVAEVRAKHLEVRRRHNLFQGRHRGLIAEVMRLRVTLHKAGHGKVFG